MLATGTTYRTLGVPGEEALLGSRIHFCSTCDGQGYICTGPDHRTSMDRVYAAGDVRRGSTKQLVSAAGDAVSCFLAIRDRVLAEKEKVKSREAV